jgi:hypothetical protein
MSDSFKLWTELKFQVPNLLTGIGIAERRESSADVVD